MINEIFSQLRKTKKLSQLRKDFLDKLINNESKGNYEKELVYYKAEIRTLQLTHKVYQNFKTFLELELNNKHFNNLSISEEKEGIENKANQILIHFKEIFSEIAHPKGELDMIIQFIDLEINNLNQFQNSPEYIKQKMLEIRDIGHEENMIERFEGDIKKRIELFLKKVNIKEKELKNLIDYLKTGGNLVVKTGEKLEEKASIFALVVVSLGLISSVGSTMAIPGVAIFGTLFSSVAFGGELLQSIPFVKKYLEEHKALHKQIKENSQTLTKMDK
jgi:hypothetical protein